MRSAHPDHCVAQHREHLKATVGEVVLHILLPVLRQVPEGMLDHDNGSMIAHVQRDVNEILPGRRTWGDAADDEPARPVEGAYGSCEVVRALSFAVVLLAATAFAWLEVDTYGVASGCRSPRFLVDRKEMCNIGQGCDGLLSTVAHPQGTIVHPGLPAVNRCGGDIKLGGHLRNCLALRGRVFAERCSETERCSVPS